MSGLKYLRKKNKEKEQKIKAILSDPNTNDAERILKLVRQIQTLQQTIESQENHINLLKIVKHRNAINAQKKTRYVKFLQKELCAFYEINLEYFKNNSKSYPDYLNKSRALELYCYILYKTGLFTHDEIISFIRHKKDHTISMYFVEKCIHSLKQGEYSKIELKFMYKFIELITKRLTNIK